MRKNAAQKGKIKPTGHAFTADYFYVYSTKGDDDFEVIKQFNIDEDREVINSILKGAKPKK